MLILKPEIYKEQLVKGPSKWCGVWAGVCVAGDASWRRDTDVF